MPSQKKRRKQIIGFIDLSKTTIHFAVRRNFTPQVFHLPQAANFTRRQADIAGLSPCDSPLREDDILPYRATKATTKGGRSKPLPYR